MRKVVAGLVFVVLGVVGYQAFRNAAAAHPVDAQAAEIACGRLATCDDGESVANRLETSPFERSYVFATSRGEVEVRCRWAYLLWGDTECKAHRESQDEIESNTPAQAPHATPRAAPGSRR